jgi:hypothetical protein
MKNLNKVGKFIHFYYIMSLIYSRIKKFDDPGLLMYMF